MSVLNAMMFINGRVTEASEATTYTFMSNQSMMHMYNASPAHLILFPLMTGCMVANTGFDLIKYRLMKKQLSLEQKKLKLFNEANVDDKAELVEEKQKQLHLLKVNYYSGLFASTLAVVATVGALAAGAAFVAAPYLFLGALTVMAARVMYTMYKTREQMKALDEKIKDCKAQLDNKELLKEKEAGLNLKIKENKDQKVQLKQSMVNNAILVGSLILTAAFTVGVMITPFGAAAVLGLAALVIGVRGGFMLWESMKNWECTKKVTRGIKSLLWMDRESYAKSTSELQMSSRTAARI